MTTKADNNNTRIYVGLVLKEEDTAYWVVFPDFETCFSCGDTVESAARNARDALDTHIDGLAQAGFTIPAPSTINDVLRHNTADIVTLLEIPATIPASAATNNVTMLRRPMRPERS